MLNFLCETLNKKGLDWNKLTAVVWYADVVSSEDIEKLARHLDDFVFIERAETDTDIGRHFVDYHTDYSASPELADFIDFASLGRCMREKLGGNFLAGSFVCMDNGCSLQHILGETQQEMTMGGF